MDQEEEDSNLSIRNHLSLGPEAESAFCRLEVQGETIN